MSTVPQEFQSSNAQAVETEAPRARATVLLAEDDAALRRYLEVVLRRAGYEVLTAVDGLEAMKVLLSTRVDAVVTDALMPHLSGHELCRFVRSHPQLNSLPILLLSGAEPAAHPSEDEGARADAYLSKPATAAQLADALARLLEA